jgi:hypothetical protein
MIQNRITYLTRWTILNFSAASFSECILHTLRLAARLSVTDNRKGGLAVGMRENPPAVRRLVPIEQTSREEIGMAPKRYARINARRALSLQLENGKSCRDATRIRGSLD